MQTIYFFQNLTSEEQIRTIEALKTLGDLQQKALSFELEKRIKADPQVGPMQPSPQPPPVAPPIQQSPPPQPPPVAPPPVQQAPPAQNLGPVSQEEIIAQMKICAEKGFPVNTSTVPQEFGVTQISPALKEKYPQLLARLKILAETGR